MQTCDLAAAIKTVQAQTGSAARIRAAATMLDAATDTVVRSVVKSWCRNPMIRRVYELMDIAQDSRVLVLTKVAQNFRFPPGAEADGQRTQELLTRYSLTVLHRYWTDRFRHIRRNRVLRALSEDTFTPKHYEIGGTIHFTDLLCEPEQPTEIPEDFLGLVRGQLDDRDLRIAVMKANGVSASIIGKEVGLSRKGVGDRIRKHIRPALAPIFQDAGYSVPGLTATA